MILVLQFCSTAIVFADYTVVLKNGRRMTVQSYREEGGTIKVTALGGELGIPRSKLKRF